VEGFIKGAECPQAIGELFNIGSGRAITIGELAQKVISLLGGNKEILSEDGRVRPDASEVMKLLCNYGKAQKVLGWEPRVSLEDGLSRTVAYIRDHLHHYKPQLYNV
jgi:nucleoside-diphosphate-sugar epimerase